MTFYPMKAEKTTTEIKTHKMTESRTKTQRKTTKANGQDFNIKLKSDSSSLSINEANKHKSTATKLQPEQE